MEPTSDASALPARARASAEDVLMQAEHVERLNQQLMLDPTRALMLGMPPMGGFAGSTLAMLFAGAATEAIPLPIQAVNLAAQVTMMNQLSGVGPHQGDAAGPSGRAAPLAAAAGGTAAGSKGKKRKQVDSKLWRKYGQKRMKGKECEGLDVIR